MSGIKLFGLMLILVGIGLGVAKYVFGMDEVGYWTLAALVPGVILSWLADKKQKVDQ